MPRNSLPVPVQILVLYAIPYTSNIGRRSVRHYAQRTEGAREGGVESRWSKSEYQVPYR